MTQKSIDTEKLLNKLAAKYPTPAYAFLANVRNSTGYASDLRSADALSMSLWPSRGLFLEGFELKVYRSDWQKELKSPAKAEAIAKYCHYWWIVAGDESVVKPEELPRTWGLMVWDGKKLKVVVNAPLQKPKAWDVMFLAGFFRNLADNVVLKSTIAEKLDAAYERGRSNADWDGKRAKLDLEELQKKVKEFEQKSGVSIEKEWHIGDIGLAVRRVKNGEDAEILARMQKLKTHAVKMVTDIDKAIGQIEQEEPNLAEAAKGKTVYL